jgi:glycyl-tRNA synthetase beta chain
LIEKKLNLDLKELLEHAIDHYNAQGIKLENEDVFAQLLTFMQERLRAWYQEQGISADVFASVAAINITNPLDMHARIQAVQAFKKLNEAEALCLANKRVSNILAKYMDTIDAKTVNKNIFENAAEKELSRQLELKKQILKELYTSGKYDAVLLQLAELHKPIDDFFNQVMVMTEDKAQRENRILLLSQLRALFLQVADIALLQ